MRQNPVKRWPYGYLALVLRGMGIPYVIETLSGRLQAYAYIHSCCEVLEIDRLAFRNVMQKDAALGFEGGPQFAEGLSM
jgi:hypothetical protein